MHPHAHTTTQTTPLHKMCQDSTVIRMAMGVIVAPPPHVPASSASPPHPSPRPLPACTYCLVKSGWPVPTYLFCKCSQLRLMLNRSAAFRLVDGGGGGLSGCIMTTGYRGFLRWKGREGRLEGAYHFDESAENWLLRLLRLPVFVFSVRGFRTGVGCDGRAKSGGKQIG